MSQIVLYILKPELLLFIVQLIIVNPWLFEINI